MSLINTQFLIKNQNCKNVALVAQSLSKILEIGDILLLKGPVGSGKSFFARSIISEYFKISKIYEDIPSPSFSLIQTYDNISPMVCHVDLYRLSFTSELEEIGLDNIYENFLTIVEWPERLGKKKPINFIEVEFKYSQNVEYERHLGIGLSSNCRMDILEWLQGLKMILES